MSQYATVQDVKDFGVMPPEEIDELILTQADIVDRIATGVSGMFDSWLQKRYETPFILIPDTLRFQVVQVVVLRLYLRRGFNPSSPQDALIQKMHDDALTWLQDASLGKIELNKAADQTPDLDEMGPIISQDNGVYDWIDVQANQVYGGGCGCSVIYK